MERQPNFVYIKGPVRDVDANCLAVNHRAAELEVDYVFRNCHNRR